MKRLSGFGIAVPPQLVWREGTWIVEQEFDLLGPRSFTNWSPNPVIERDGFTFAPMVWGAGAPVIMSEICAEAADYDAQIAVMDEVAALLRNKTLTAAFWFSSHVGDDSQWHNATLCSVDTLNQRVMLTPLGEYFIGLDM